MGDGSLPYAFAAAVGMMIADGCLQCARAQCAPDAQIFIDPRLAPHRVPVTREQVVNTLASQRLSPEVKKRVRENYYAQDQPIEVPFRGGTVLIHPHDPCVQQYIER